MEQATHDKGEGETENSDNVVKVLMVVEFEGLLLEDG